MRIKRGLISALALGAVVAVSGCASGVNEGTNTDETMKKVVFMLDVNILPKHSIFFAAVAKGFYAKEGLDVEILPGTGSLNASIAVGTKTADFGFGDFAAMVGGRASGNEVKQVLSIHAQSPFAIVTTADSGISSWDDLRGKKVAGEAAGTTTQLFPLALERAGIDVDEVEFVPVDGTAKVPGLLAGQWDATVGFSVSDPAVMIGLGVEPRTLMWSELGFEMYSAGIIASDQMIASDPELVEAFVRATANGVKWACDNQPETAKIMVEEFPETNLKAAEVGTEAVCEILWVPESEKNGLGYMAEEGVQRVIDIAQEYLGLQGDPILPSDVYSNKFNPGILQSTKVEAP